MPTASESGLRGREKIIWSEQGIVTFNILRLFCLIWYKIKCRKI
jgi:hypothetical protein